MKSGGADLCVVGSVVGNGAVEHHMRGHSARLCAEGRSGCEAEHAGGECDHPEKAEKGRLHEANRSEGAVRLDCSDLGLRKAVPTRRDLNQCSDAQIPVLSIASEAYVGTFC